LGGTGFSTQSFENVAEATAVSDNFDTHFFQVGVGQLGGDLAGYFVVG
jgi:hypothetical protein